MDEIADPSSIAHYRITAKIGHGGMGEVYRATDTKLGRQVAIKVLPEAFAQVPDRLTRFAREARVLASLNHPNIAAIYGVEERALIIYVAGAGARKAGRPALGHLGIRGSAAGDADGAAAAVGDADSGRPGLERTAGGHSRGRGAALAALPGEGSAAPVAGDRGSAAYRRGSAGGAECGGKAHRPRAAD